MNKSSHLVSIFAAIIMIFGLLFSNDISGQEYHGGAHMPGYNGGNKALKEMITDNLICPDSIMEKGISGMVTVKLTINKLGKVENIKLMRGIYSFCDAEAIRVAGLLVDWFPADNWGTTADCSVLLNVDFPGENTQYKAPVFVTGTVCNINTGQPLIGAFIFVKGTNIGTLTDADGKYLLELNGDNYDLEISFIGYYTKTEHIGYNRTINIELEKGYCLLDSTIEE